MDDFVTKLSYSPLMDVKLSTESGEWSSQAARVFLELEDEIVRGKIPMGTRLREEGLAARFGISRGTLREALRRLEGRSLVQSAPRLGVRVVEIDHSDMVELYEVREALECMSVRLATQRMSDEELSGLRSLLQRNADKLGGADEQYSQGEGDDDFHFRIALGSHSRRMKKLLCGDLYSLIRMCRYRTWLIPGQRRTGADHESIMAAMEQRDAELAEMLMRRHVRSARDRFVQAIDTGADGAV
jgi:DNA-binding GntR family transcriptional regulator